MPSMLLGNELMPYLRYSHGIYNTLVILFFIYQGWLGIKIRKERLVGKQPTFLIIKRHRKFGQVLVPLSVFGYLAGVTIVYIRTGLIFEYPLHFINGSVIILLSIATFFISRRIKGRNPSWRTKHFAVGICIIILYFFQAFLGVGILF